MPTRIDRDWNIVVPKGESFGFVLRNYGTAQVTDMDIATLCVCDKNGKVLLEKRAETINGVFWFNIGPEETQDMTEGVNLYDLIVEQYDAQGTMTARHTVFAPQLRRFVIGRVADGGE